ncbi:DUF58 domain-containing protein [Myxococcota bacterium]|nr:DUF58 domain-containing protein [Myxococcota bacterium]
MSTSTSFDPAFLDEIEGLMLVARQVADGAVAGIHPSRRRGSSIEFSEHKLYTPGDDIRRMDWRAYAKTDRYHIKEYEDETNQNIEILLDISNSMTFSGEADLTKLNFARMLASGLAYLAVNQGDKVALTLFSNDVTHSTALASGSPHLARVLNELTSIKPGGETHLAVATAHFLSKKRKHTSIFILTDLFDPHPGIELALRSLVAARHDVTLLHILDPQEINFDFEAPAHFAAMEDSRKLFVHPRLIRATYQKEMDAFLEKTERTLGAAGISYHRALTDASAAMTLRTLLQLRQG